MHQMKTFRRLFCLCLCCLLLCACTAPLSDGTEPTEDPTPDLTNGKTFKFLAITSSFGKNTTQLLYDIAMKEGYENVTVARLYGSGATLANHVENASKNAAFYEYTKISTAGGGRWNTLYPYDKDGVKGATMEQGLLDEDWDIILIQQSAAHAPQARFYGTYIIDLIKYINTKKTNPNAKFVWNMCWAYQKDSDDQYVFPKFDKDQMKMYNGLVEVQNQFVVPNKDISAIIPTGTTIQNARTSYIGDHLTKDGMHLNTLGKVFAGYTLFSTLTGREVTEIKLDQITKEMAHDSEALTLTESDKQVIVEAVNNAVKNPHAVTQSVYTQK